MTKQSAAQLAQRALLYEVSCFPKPGLVDPLDHTTHADMDLFTFIDSSVALVPYFEQFVQAGAAFEQSDLTQLMAEIRPIGRQAEAAMFQATNGVNTHKGAIFSLGIFLSATGYLQQRHTLTLARLQQTIQAMLVGLVEHDFEQVTQKTPEQLTNGEKLYLQYGLTGIRGEAAAGYPSVFANGVPYLQLQTGDWNDRLLNTLFNLLSTAEDTNLIKRSRSLETMQAVQGIAQQIVQSGGVQTESGSHLLATLNQTANKRNYSLGGTADLLIVTIYVTLLFA